MQKKSKYILGTSIVSIFTISIILGIYQTIEQNKQKQIAANFDIPLKNSALVLDLEQTGIKTFDIQKGVYFDFDANDFAETTGWIYPQEGLLVQDVNKNQIIDNGNEVFGNNYDKYNKINGFENLKHLDKNKDNILDKNDPDWHNILIWVDKNINGLSEKDELSSLSQLKIKEIDLNYKIVPSQNDSPNVVGLSSHFKRNDNSIGQIAEVWFNVNYTRTKDKLSIKIPKDIVELPQIQGYGNVHNLHTALALEPNGKLRELIQQYIQEKDARKRLAMLDPIIFHWTGVQNIAPDSRKPDHYSTNPIQDARYLASLEIFMGKKYTNNNFTDSERHNPGDEASKYLLSAYQLNKKYVKNQLESQTHCSIFLKNIELMWDNAQKKWLIDSSKALKILDKTAKNDPKNIQQIITNIQDILEQHPSHFGPNILEDIRNRAGTVPHLKKYIQTMGLDSTPPEPLVINKDGIITGTDKDNILIGTAETKEIYGKGGNDIIIGGPGNNFLSGGDGSDKYIFAQNWGHDIIDNTSQETPSKDCIIFGALFPPQTIFIEKQQNDLKLYLSDNSSSIIIKNYFMDNGTTSHTINCISFNDGTSWNYNDIIEKINNSTFQ